MSENLGWKQIAYWCWHSGILVPSAALMVALCRIMIMAIAPRPAKLPVNLVRFDATIDMDMST